MSGWWVGITKAKNGSECPSITRGKSTTAKDTEEPVELSASWTGTGAGRGMVDKRNSSTKDLEIKFAAAPESKSANVSMMEA
jgi:hypothetical protein